MRTTINIADLQAQAVVENKNLLGDLTSFDFMKDYNENAELFDSIITYDYESMIFRTSIEVVPTALQYFQQLVKAFLTKYSYKYKGLYNSTLLEYNPIENYSMAESGTDIRTPNIKHEMVEKFGESSSTDTSTNQTSPFDTQNWTNTDKNVIENITNAKTNNTTNTETGTENTKHELKRSGNIGVTTSQQMLESERKIVNYSFIEQVITDIVNNFFYYDDMGGISI